MSSSHEAITNPLGATPGERFGASLRRWWRQAVGQSRTDPSSAAAASGVLLRQSKGLREFWSTLQGSESLNILDFGPASQANLNFITGLGHRLCTEDLYSTLQWATARTLPQPDDSAEERHFFQENLAYQPGHFDGILCWDLFDFVEDPLVRPLVARLHELLKPGGLLLSFFHAGQPGQALPVCQYRIHSQDQLQLTERAQGKLRRTFNNRGIEGLFQNFTSLKFYLTRDSLREVIIVR